MRLSINLDHVATLREARQVGHPEILDAARSVLLAGADGVTVHLREDRRHIKDRDVLALRKIIRKPHELNLELSLHPSVLRTAKLARPDQITLVPEKREELTTEGGLHLEKNKRKILGFLKTFGRRSRISFFIEPSSLMVRQAKKLGADAVEIHTGKYSYLRGERKKKEKRRILRAIDLAASLGLRVHIGHGLDRGNITPLLRAGTISETSIGFSVISEAVLAGLGPSVRALQRAIRGRK